MCFPLGATDTISHVLGETNSQSTQPRDTLFVLKRGKAGRRALCLFTVHAGLSFFFYLSSTLFVFEGGGGMGLVAVTGVTAWVPLHLVAVLHGPVVGHLHRLADVGLAALQHLLFVQLLVHS